MNFFKRKQDAPPSVQRRTNRQIIFEHVHHHDDPNGRFDINEFISSFKNYVLREIDDSNGYRIELTYNENDYNKLKNAYEQKNQIQNGGMRKRVYSNPTSSKMKTKIGPRGGKYIIRNGKKVYSK